MSQSVRTDEEVVVIPRLIDTHAPKDDRRMVPVTANHAANIVDGDVLPCLVADMLPSGDLFEHKKTKLIAGIEKMSRLSLKCNIVRTSHDPQILLVAGALFWSALMATLADAGRETAAAISYDDPARCPTSALAPCQR